MDFLCVQFQFTTKQNNIPIITGENSITYFVDKSSIKSIEEDQSIYIDFYNL